MVKSETQPLSSQPIQPGEVVDVDEYEAKIDALIEKFRAQEDPNIEEI